MALQKRPKKQFIPPALQITAMMDMFTIILIFLLFSFSNNPEILDLDKKISLPESTSKLHYKDSIRLILTNDELKLDGEVVSILKDGKIEKLDVLYNKLSAFRETADRLKETELDMQRREHILFMCDKTHSFRTINAIVKTAGRAGYPNFQFAVVEKGE